MPIAPVPDPIAIVGLAHRLPGPNGRPLSSPELWRALIEGRDLVTQVETSRWPMSTYQHPRRSEPGTSMTFAAGSIGDVTGFDAGFFGISPREAARMDPQQRLMLELSWEAFEDAGIRPSLLRGLPWSVFLGVSSLDYAYRRADDLSGIDARTITGNAASICANRLSYFFDLRGPSLAVDTACSSSLVALHQACQSIRSGESAGALVGGVSLHLHPYTFIGFSKAAMLSPKGRCRVFDEDGDGYVRSEGGALVLLKPLARALADGNHILAVVAGSSVNTDGHKSGLTVPSHAAQAELLRRAYGQAGIAALDIDYLEAHGTGTAVGDPIEAQAIGEAIGMARPRGRPLAIGSVKSNLGHLEAASGMAGLVKALLTIRHRRVPPTIHFEKPNTRIAFDQWNLAPVTQPLPLPAGRAVTVGVNSFGFGGANAHVILQSYERADMRVAAAPPPASAPLLLSAQTEPALRALAASMARHLEEHAELALYDVAYCAAFHREALDHRLLADCADREALLRSLREFSAAGSPAGILAGCVLPRASAPAFVYSGNGSQWAGMGRRLLQQPAFRRAAEEVDALVRAIAPELSILDELEAPGRQSRLEFTEVAQPALFAMQVGLTELLRERGIRPGAVCGHSCGEVAAAWACGALTLPEAARIICARSAQQGRTKGAGKMTVVALDAEAVRALLAASGLAERVHIAGINGPRGTTVVGAVDALAELEAALAAQRTIFKRLDLDYPFHGPAMEPLRAPLESALGALAPRSTRVAYFSCVTGSALDAARLDAEYWWHNVRDPVLFADAIGSMAQAGFNTFIEVGPDAVLAPFLNDCVKNATQRITGYRARVFATMRRADAGVDQIERIQRELLVAAVPIDTARLFPATGRFVDLPRYPWQRERYWQASTSESLALLAREPVHPLLGYALAGSALTWETQLDTTRLPYLEDHKVAGATVFPAAAFAEMALAAGRQWAPQHPIAVEELEIHAPLLLSQERSKTVRLQVEAASGRFAIVARERLSTDAWTAHASGRLAQLALEPAEPPLALPEAAPQVDAARHYDALAEWGLHYGPAFRAVESAWAEPGAVLARLATPEAVAGQECASVLHPAYLDGAFQLLAELLLPELGAPGQAKPGAAESAAGRAAFLPVRIGRLTVLAPGERACAARATLVRRGARSLVADFTLYGEAGRPVALARGVRFVAARIRRDTGAAMRLLAMRTVPMPRRFDARAAELPAVRELAARCAQRLHAPRRNEARHRYAAEVEPLLDVLCAAFAMQAVRDIAGGAAAIDPRQLLATGSVAPDAESLLYRLLQILAEEGVIEQAGSRWLWRDGPELPQPEDVWASLVADYPEYAFVTGRIGSIGRRLGARLRTGSSGATGGSGVAERPGAWTQTCTRAEASDLVATLAELIRHAVATQSEGGRLRALCLMSSPPLEGIALLPGLDLDRCDLVIGTASAEALERWQALLRHTPAVAVCDVDVDAAQPAEAAALGGAFDIVVLADGLAQAPDPQQRLRNVHRVLAEDGLLVLLEQHPSRPVDFINGVDPRWWLVDADGRAVASRLRTPDHWVDVLAAAGYADAEPVADIVPAPDLPAEGAGPYLVLARAARAASQQPLPAVEDTVSQTWIVLQDEQGYSAELGAELEHELSTQGHRVITVSAAPAFAAVGADRFAVDPASVPDWGALLESLAHEGLELTGWIHLHGLDLASAEAAAEARAGLQLARVNALVAWLRACAAAHIAPDAWIVGAHAALGLLPEAVRARVAARGRVDGQRDAPLWGATRVAVNECSEMRVRWADLADPHPSVLNAAKLAREILHPDDEDEIILTQEGRFAPRLGAASIDAAPAEQAAPGVRLELPVGGALKDLGWRRFELAAPGPGEVEIEVRAAGLNFRDVMYGMGLLPEEALEGGFAGATLGMELAGVVARVGAGVDGLAPGDAVLAFAPAAFGNRVLTKAGAVVPKPVQWSFAAAATVPTAFFTVYYALGELARLREGERVLIHGAAGAVGIAAIQLARHLGAEVYATAGTQEKRDFVRLLGARHVFDSRSLAFADEILQATGGEGVDVVLNSLAGEAAQRSLRILRPFGRMIELGKRDFYENGRMDLRPFRNNIAYFGVDADQLVAARPELARRMLLELLALFTSGVLHPLPYQSFDAGEIEQAFQYMRDSRQTGKVVIAFASDFDPPAPPPRASAPARMRADATYLVSGGLSGFGLRSAQWLAERGARHLVLLGRRGAATPGAAEALEQLARQGVQAAALACDVTDAQACAAALAEVCGRMPPLRGVIHAAMVMDDALICSLDAERLERVLAPKVLGAAHLDELTRADALDFFVLYSSATTLLGNPGQAGYVAANMALEALADERRAAGLPATCVLWGPIGDAGYLARNTTVRDSLTARLGGHALAADEALAVLGRILGAAQAPRANLGVLDVDWNKVAQHLPGAGAPKYADLARDTQVDGSALPAATDLRAWLTALRPEEVEPALAGILKVEIATILRISPDRIEPGRSLFDMGMDSLMALELAMALDSRLGIRLPAMALGEGPTIERLAQRILAQLRPAALGEEAAAPADDIAANVQALAAQHGGDVSAQSIDQLSAALRAGEGAPGSLLQRDPAEKASADSARRPDAAA